MTFNLIIHVPDEDPVLYELNADRIGVGRTPDNQIQIDVSTVSAAHFELRKRDEDFEIADLNSRNGIRVNGLRVNAPIPLQDGDRILIGETVPAYFVALAEGADPEEAVRTGSSAVQRSAASYVSLDDKVHLLEGKLETMQSVFESKQLEFQKLTRAISKLEDDIKDMVSRGEDPAALEAMESDLLVKTQRVTILKSDLADAERKLFDLQKNTEPGDQAPKPPIAPPAQVAPLAPSAPAAPSAPSAPKSPPIARPPSAPSFPKVAPLKPPGAPSLPPGVAPKKPPTFKKPESE